MVWADEEPGQSAPGQLHVNFKLSGAGEALGLFAPDGVPVDALSFGIQSNNVAQGAPDGGPEPFAFLTVPAPGAGQRAGGGEPAAGTAADCRRRSTRAGW